MSVEITRYPTHYQVTMGLSTYLFTPSDYDALFHAILATPASDVVWVSCVTADMVSDPEDCGSLIDELDDAVMAACEDNRNYAAAMATETCNHAETRPLDCDACETCQEIVCVACGESVEVSNA